MAGGVEVKLDLDTVFNYLVSGDKSGITEQELVLFIKMCEYQGLNPFAKDAYLVKYSSSEPAQHVISKSALEKRANRHPKYRGRVSGIIVQRTDGQIEYRIGEFRLQEEKLVGGWCKVFVDGFAQPVESSVSFVEYNTGKSSWAKKPGTMIHKVAVAHALRAAFPENFAGMYIAEETEDHSVPDIPIESPIVDVPQNVVETGFAPPPMPMEQPEFDDFSALMEG
jgi:phage recombination protein Bet